MRKILTVTGSLIILTLTACTTDNTPATRKLYRNIQSIPASTSLGVTARDDYNIPDYGQVTEQSGLFTTIDEVYDSADNRILIPSGATIGGIYINDGKTCKIIWKSVYANNDVSGQADNSIPLTEVTRPTLCNPNKGIKAGARLNVNFSSNE